MTRAETPPARILVVDDEPGIQRTVERILSRRHRVTQASSGQEALAALRREAHDLAIVDVRMPGMNGFEVLKSIKAEHPDTEVIIMTGSISNPDEKLVEALRERAFYFIRKPFEKTVLETLVDRCLERQRLERENRAYTDGLERDLEQARSFQRLLLPRSFPLLPGLRGDACYVPSARLSGDFYEYFELGPAQVGVLIADVSGHGVSAALYTGMLKSEMQAVHDEWRRPERLFRRLNDRILEVVTQRHYVTAVLAILDLAAREVRYVSAGHPGFLDRDGRTWDSTGTPLGMLVKSDYEVASFPLRPRERLLFYTDGLTEAMRQDSEMFGIDRLRDAFGGTQDLALDAAVRHVVATARTFSGLDSFTDDATAILLEYDP